MPRTIPPQIILILRCVTHTLTDDSHFRQRSHSLLPQDACRTSWQVMCSRSQLNVSDKRKISQTCGKLQTQSKSNCLHACISTTLHKTAKQITVVSAHKTHRPHVKLMTADRKLLKLSSTSPDSVQPEIVQNSEIPRHPKTLFHSNLNHSFCISPRSCLAASKPSTTTRLGATTKTYTLGGDLPTQTILWASAANLYNKLPFSSNSKAFI